MSKPSQLLESINQQLIQLNKNQFDMMAKQSTTHAMVKQLRVEMNNNNADIGGLKESRFKTMGGWQVLVAIGSALLSIAAIVAVFLN